MPEFREVWRSRDLALILAWRDVKVRYKQSLIGIAWAVLQPLLTMVVFTLIFGKFADLPAQGLPYPVFSMLNLVAWMFLAAVFTLTSGCVLTNRTLVQKVHFPLLILPLACILVPLVDFIFSFTVALGITAWYDISIQSTVVLVPLFLLMLAATGIGLGSFLAVINVRYRDVPYAVPFLVQLWLFASGVIYAADAIPERYLNIASLNPAVGGDHRLPLGRGRHAGADRDDARARPDDDRDRLRRRPVVLPARGAALRGHPVKTVVAEGISKRYRIGEYKAGYQTLRDTLRPRRPPRAPARARRPLARGALGPQGRVVHDRRGRGRGLHRTQRLGQVDAPEDPHPDHAADRGERHGSAAAWGASSRSGPASTPS